MLWYYDTMTSYTNKRGFKMKKYSLRWWFEFGRRNNLATHCYAKSKICKLAFKIGQIAA